MRLRHILFLLIAVNFAVQSFEGTAFWAVTDIKAYDKFKIDGIWRVNCATGEKKQLFGNNDGSRIVGWTRLSWDGKKIYFTAAGKQYIMDNDGGNLTRLDEMRTLDAGPAFTKAGLLYGAGYKDHTGKMWRHDLATNKETLELELKGFVPTAMDRGVAANNLGEVIWGRLYQDNPDPSVKVNHGQDVSNSGEIYVHYSKDRHLLKLFSFFQHGHGECILTGGRKVLHQHFGSHNGIWIRRTSDGVTIGSYTYGIVLEKKSEWGTLEGRPFTCINSNDHIALQLIPRCSKVAADQRYVRNALYNVRTDKVDGWIPNPTNGQEKFTCEGHASGRNSKVVCFGLWHGNDLPAPTESKPHMMALDKNIHFDCGGQSGIIIKPVEIWNIGAGDLGPVLTEIQPSGTGWLTVQNNGLYGNKQYVLLSADPSKVPSDNASAKIILSSTSARNSITVNVTANNKRLPAPSYLIAAQTDAKDRTKAIVAWSEVEGADGYIVETCNQNSYHCPDGKFSEKKKVATTHLEVSDNVWGAAQTRYLYRVKAYSNSGALETSSASLNSDFVHRDYVTLLQPRQGMMYKTGQKIEIAWMTNRVKKFNLEYSSDFGKSWQKIASGVTDGSSDGYHFSYAWSVPSSLDGKNVIVRVMDGDSPEVWSIRNSFARDIRFGTDGMQNAAMRQWVNPSQIKISIQKTSNGIIVRSNTRIGGRASLYASNGKLLSRMKLSGNADSLISTKGLSAGAYLVKIRGDGGKQIIKHFAHNR